MPRPQMLHDLRCCLSRVAPVSAPAQAPVLTALLSLTTSHNLIPKSSPPGHQHGVAAALTYLANTADDQELSCTLHLRTHFYVICSLFEDS